LAIQKCLAGDWESFRYLVEKYQGRAAAHALAIVGGREDVLDAVQEAFLDAFQALVRFDQGRPFYPWFYAILRNRCFKLLAGRQKLEVSSLGEIEAEILAPASSLSPEELLALERALLALSPEDRELITLRHLCVNENAWAMSARLMVGSAMTIEKIFRNLMAVALTSALMTGGSKAFAAIQDAAAQTGASNQSIEGAWEGTLDFGGAKLRLVLKVSKGADGSLTAKADSPDQGATDLPVDAISLKDGAVRFEMIRLMASYEGTLNREASEIAGEFKQGGTSLPLTLKRTAKPTALNRPQEPKRPYPYDEEEVGYENKRDGVKLAGTLTLPRGKGPFPAALLITGSGPQDRNESLLGHKPFLVLADYLTRRGLAVLRVDDRGVGGSTGSVANSTTEDFATDVMAGIEILKTRKEIDPKRIGLIGHSEGGLIAPMVAAQNDDVAFIVLMAGTGLTGEEILYLQGALIMKANGASAEQLAKQRATQASMFKILKEEKDPATAEKRIYQELSKSLTEEEKKKSEQTILVQAKQVNTPWFRYFLTLDPRPPLQKVKCPVLVLNGENDLQVPVNENLREIEAALKAGGNKDVTIARLPKLNHLFQTSETGSPNEYIKIEETIAPVALKTIGDWVLNRTTTQR
jgi:RNA polymerase sigma factor (sigma-70 family)